MWGRKLRTSSTKLTVRCSDPQMSRAFSFSPLPPPESQLAGFPASQGCQPSAAALAALSPPAQAVVPSGGEGEGCGWVWSALAHPTLLRIQDSGPGLGISTDPRRGMRAGPETAEGTSPSAGRPSSVLPAQPRPTAVGTAKAASPRAISVVGHVQIRHGGRAGTFRRGCLPSPDPGLRARACSSLPALVLVLVTAGSRHCPSDAASLPHLEGQTASSHLPKPLGPGCKRGPGRAPGSSGREERPGVGSRVWVLEGDG